MSYVKGSVLDIGAGAGRHSLYLQGKGHEVLGIDNSPLALEVCRLRGLRNTKLLPVREISPRLGVFDTVLMMGDNFGLLGDFDTARRLLERLNKIASERGRMISETIDVYQPEAPEHLSYHERNRRGGRMAGQIRLRVRYRSYTTPWFDYLMVSKEVRYGDSKTLA